MVGDNCCKCDCLVVTFLYLTVRFYRFCFYFLASHFETAIISLVTTCGYVEIHDNCKQIVLQCKYMQTLWRSTYKKNMYLTTGQGTVSRDVCNWTCSIDLVTRLAPLNEMINDSYIGHLPTVSARWPTSITFRNPFHFSLPKTQLTFCHSDWLSLFSRDEVIG